MNTFKINTGEWKKRKHVQVNGYSSGRVIPNKLVQWEERSIMVETGSFTIFLREVKNRANEPFQFLPNNGKKYVSISKKWFNSIEDVIQVINKL